MKAYVILSKGYEYNDEVFSEPESGVGHQRKSSSQNQRPKKR